MKRPSGDRRFKVEASKFVSLLLKESLDPGRAAAAVFFGIFIGILPVYGFHALAAVGLAVLFKLNKPLTLACTFISNPLFQPLLVFCSVELGCLLRYGSFQPLSLSALAAMRGHISKEQFYVWVIGSLALGLLLGAVGGVVIAVVVRLHRKSTAGSEIVPS